jgi:hypothetical protein
MVAGRDPAEPTMAARSGGLEPPPAAQDDWKPPSEFDKIRELNSQGGRLATVYGLLLTAYTFSAGSEPLYLALRSRIGLVHAGWYGRCWRARPGLAQSAGSDRQIVTRSQLVSVSWFRTSAGWFIPGRPPLGKTHAAAGLGQPSLRPFPSRREAPAAVTGSRAGRGLLGYDNDSCILGPFRCPSIPRGQGIEAGSSWSSVSVGARIDRS